MTISPHTFAGIPPEEEVGAQQGGGEPGLLRQLGAGLFPTIGAGLVQALLPKGERRGFSEQFIRQTQLMEQRREQQRQKDEAFVRQIAISRPEILAQLPAEARESFVAAVAEPFEEITGGGGQDISGIRPAVEQFLTAKAPLSPEQAINIFGVATRAGDINLARMALRIADPNLTLSVAQQQGMTPNQIATLTQSMVQDDQFTSESRQALNSQLAEAMIANDFRGIDLGVLEFDPTIAGENPGEYINALATEGEALLRGGRFGEFGTRHATAILKKMGQIPERFDRADAMRMFTQGIAENDALWIRAGEDNRNVPFSDKLQSAFSEALRAADRAMDQLQVVDPSSEAALQIFLEIAPAQLAFSTRDPEIKRAYAANIRRQIIKRNPKLAEPENKAALNRAIKEQIEKNRQIVMGEEVPRATP